MLVRSKPFAKKIFAAARRIWRRVVDSSDAFEAGSDGGESGMFAHSIISSYTVFRTTNLKKTPQ
jgi:hypothetical protein